MLGRYRTAWHLVVSTVLAAFLATVPVEWISLDVVASDACATADEVRATTCRLLDSAEPLVGQLEGPGVTATYRLDVLGPGATVNLMISSENDTVNASLVDWRGTALGQAKQGTRAARKKLTATVPLAGVYGVQVEGDVSDSARYAVWATVSYPEQTWQPVWPLELAGTGPLTGERQVLRTPRGGTPEAGVAVARALRAPPEGEVGDFTLVADVQFEKIVGPSALTIRFRYEPRPAAGPATCSRSIRSAAPPPWTASTRGSARRSSTTSRCRSCRTSSGRVGWSSRRRPDAERHAGRAAGPRSVGRALRTWADRRGRRDLVRSGRGHVRPHPGDRPALGRRRSTLLGKRSCKGGRMLAALQTGIRSVEVREIPDPTPNADQGLIRVRQVGICGSDLHPYHRRAEPQTTPAGHEICGEVASLPVGYDGPVAWATWWR